jgi:hypothetical protein
MQPPNNAKGLDLQPRLQASGHATDPVWERPRRPSDPEPSRWRNVLPPTALVLIAAGAWFAFPDSRSTPQSGQVAVSAPTAPSAAPDADRVSFSLVDASWGAVIEAEPDRDVHAPEPTTDELREQAFHKAAAERWKGVEIFVRRDR